MRNKKPKSRKKDRSKISVGGLVGSMSGGSITNSSFSGKIIVDASYDDYMAGRLQNLNVGGIAGQAQNAEMDNVRSDAKFYIRDSQKFESLEKALEKAVQDAKCIQLAKLELQGIKANIGKPDIPQRIKRFLNIVKGARDVVEPYIPYLMSLA